jgi:hypothetical protein
MCTSRSCPQPIRNIAFGPLFATQYIVLFRLRLQADLKYTGEYILDSSIEHIFAKYYEEQIRHDAEYTLILELL